MKYKLVCPSLFLVRTIGLVIATWFALTASLMNLSLVAGSLLSKYLNLIFVVERGSYAQLPALLASVLALGLVMPVATILVFGRRLR